MFRCPASTSSTSHRLVEIFVDAKKTLKAPYYQCCHGIRVTSLHNPALQVTEGRLLRFSSPHSLSASDCGQLALTARDLGRLDLELDWLREAVRLAGRKSPGGGGSLARLKARLRESRRFHDEVLLEHGYFVPREKYEAVLGRVEAGMPVVTKMRPDQRRLRNDSRLAGHLETMVLRDKHSQHLNTNNPELHFGDDQINTVMFNLLHRESDNMTRLCSGAATRHPDQDRDLRCRLLFSHWSRSIEILGSDWLMNILKHYFGIMVRGAHHRFHLCISWKPSCHQDTVKEKHI